MGMKKRPAPSAGETELLDRIRQAMGPRTDVSETRMFGGVAFMVRGHMSVGVARGNLMVRVGPEQYDDALGQPHARPMDFTGKPLRGFVYVEPAGCTTVAAIRPWIKRSFRFVETLPAR